MTNFKKLLTRRWCGRRYWGASKILFLELKVVTWGFYSVENLMS